MSRLNYDEFIKNKALVIESAGIDISTDELNPLLFDFQKNIVRWALAKGRAAIFADCGLGKTAMQLEWAEQIRKRTGGKVIVIAPLAVASQTKEEGAKFGIDVNICTSQADVVASMVNITNYEKLEKFTGSEFTAVVLDESSILKSYSGKMKTGIIEKFENVPYKLSCTATPSPNDTMELLNQAEFLNVLKSHEALAVWFVTDQNSMGAYRLKHHAEDDFWTWVSSWAVLLKNHQT